MVDEFAKAGPIIEEHFTPAEVAAILKISLDSARALMLREPGAVVLKDMKGESSGRRYRQPDPA